MIDYARLKTKITEAIDEPAKRDSLYRCMKRGRDKRLEMLADLPGGADFRDQVKATKVRCIEDQDRLLETFIQNAEKRGATVFVAKDAKDAIQYCLDLAQQKNAKTVAKSKSLTTEEIEINHPLEEAGLHVVETDLGELIIQLVNEKPYHLVFPSVHHDRDAVAKIFSDETGKPVENTIESIMPVVREYLRPIFLNADIGMTGANVGIAETGAIVIETNEGNARLVSSIPDTHVCVMGMEKIVETVEDALLMVLAHPVSATGQLPTTYVTIMGGRSDLGTDPERQPRESHIVILDNGRTEMRNDPVMREALHCIRCGACMNICPTYGVVGGHTFGYIYPGPIGIPWTAEVHGLDKAANFAPLCISCGLCKEICPAEIDMPNMIAEVKHREMKRSGTPRVEKVLMGADDMAKLGSALAPVSNWFLQSKPFRIVMEKATGVSRKRAIPPFARRTFKKRFARRAVAKHPSPKKRVAFFVDVYANYNAPQLGIAAVDALEAAGCEVIVPDQKSSGYPYIAYGDLDRARRSALENTKLLAPHVKVGYDIVTVEPTAAYSLAVSYPKLLQRDENSRIVAENTYELFEYLLKIEEPPEAQPLAGKKLGFHCSCHQRPLGSGHGAMEWARRRGADVQLVETGTCCGMGGTFGLKAGPLGYDLSVAVGEPLFEAFREAGVEAIITESSVCSIQLREGTALPVYHPLEMLSLT